jgi:hypothetical protein
VNALADKPKTAIPIALLPACWRLSSLAETVASVCASAACYRGSENIDVIAVVVAELKLRDVEREIFAADLVIGADNPALHDRPEAFNRVGVDRTDNVVTRALANDVMREIPTKQPIARVFVGRQQADFVGHGFVHEAIQCRRVGIVDHTQDNITLAADGPNDSGLASPDTARTAVALIAMLICGFAADIGFVYFDDAHELAELLILQGSANAMANVPSGFVRTEAHEVMNLPRAHSLLAGEHQVDDFEPVSEIDLRILENRADEMGEAISAPLTAIRALPLKFHGFERIDVLRAAARAADTIGPAASDQIVVASLLIGEQFLELPRGQLNGLLGHDGSPY